MVARRAMVRFPPGVAGLDTARGAAGGVKRAQGRPRRRSAPAVARRRRSRTDLPRRAAPRRPSRTAKPVSAALATRLPPPESVLTPRLTCLGGLLPHPLARPYRPRVLIRRLDVLPSSRAGRLSAILSARSRPRSATNSVHERPGAPGSPGARPAGSPPAAARPWPGTPPGPPPTPRSVPGGPPSARTLPRLRPHRKLEVGIQEGRDGARWSPAQESGDAEIRGMGPVSPSGENQNWGLEKIGGGGASITPSLPHDPPTTGSYPSGRASGRPLAAHHQPRHAQKNVQGPPDPAPLSPCAGKGATRDTRPASPHPDG